MPNGPPPHFGPLVRTGLMILFMVLDQYNYADGLVWTNSPNGPGVEFDCRIFSVDLNMTGVFLVVSGDIFLHHTTMTASDNDSGVSEAPATATTSFIIVVS